jgi:hypothetical protein
MRRLEADVVALEKSPGAPQALVDPTKRRTAIAEIKQPVLSPAATSRCRCIIGRRTSACVPVR